MMVLIMYIVVEIKGEKLVKKNWNSMYNSGFFGVEMIVYSIKRKSRVLCGFWYLVGRV